jgi:hypothetical protein
MVISKQYPTKYLAMSFSGREDKRELYILSYGTLTPPCKAQDSFTWIYIYVCQKIYKLILLYCQLEIWQNVYPQSNHIFFIFGPYSLLIDSDSAFVSAHYPLWFQIQKNYWRGFNPACPYLRVFDSWSVCGRWRIRRLQTETGHTREFTQVLPPGE